MKKTWKMRLPSEKEVAAMSKVKTKHLRLELPRLKAITPWSR